MKSLMLLSAALSHGESIPDLENQESIDWYKGLDLNQKINLKDCFKLLCGVDFDKIGKILSFKQRICLMHSKLRAEGFEV